VASEATGRGYPPAPAHGGQRQRGAASGQGATGYNGNGYQDSGYGYPGNGGSRRDAAGYGVAQDGQRSGPPGGRSGSGYGGNGRPGSAAHAPEFTPSYSVDIDEAAAAGTPRPYGRLSIYTLNEGKAREFDRLAEIAAEGVRAAEPDTLVYVIHVVPRAPMQRIIYEIYRDRAAFLAHEQQPHIKKFAADRASCVLATNVIDLRLKYAKVSAMGSPAQPPMPSPAGWAPRTPEPATGNGRYQAAGAQYPAAQQQPTQYSQAQQAGAPSFTPAKDQYVDVGQPTVGREAFSAAARPGSNPAGGYGSSGSYSSASSYQSPNGYSTANGYGGGYPAADRHQGANGRAEADSSGYSAANGYANGGSYQNGNGTANGNSYSAANAYANGGNYQNGNGYGAAGGNGAGQSPQYTPRYRELTSGSSPSAGPAYQENASRYADGRQPDQPQQPEWSPRPRDQR
jgi:quinol monooxygenase YgiN